MSLLYGVRLLSVLLEIILITGHFVFSMVQGDGGGSSSTRISNEYLVIL